VELRRGIRTIGRPLVYGAVVAPKRFALTTSDVSHATVTETAILRSRLEDLQKLVEGQGAQIQKLRLQVQALRGGARLAEEP